MGKIKRFFCWLFDLPTAEEFYREHVAQWEWLAENPDSDAADYPGFRRREDWIEGEVVEWRCYRIRPYTTLIYSLYWDRRQQSLVDSLEYMPLVLQHSTSLSSNERADLARKIAALPMRDGLEVIS